MQLSLFDMFKVGIGPSSSHTMGPMLAAHHFLNILEQEGLFAKVGHIQVELYGSLALTGIGHCTDKAIMLGLEGELPETINPDIIDSRTNAIRQEKILYLAKKKKIPFHWQEDLIFLRRKVLALHANGMIFKSFDVNKNLLNSGTYFSIGGGHIRTEAEMNQPKEQKSLVKLPYEFNSGQELLELGKKHKLHIHQMMLANEQVWRTEKEIFAKIDFLWQMMSECIQRGCQKDGTLPGRLQVQRRASKLFRDLEKKTKTSTFQDPLSVLDWVTLYALAVNEENASGSKIVTAPTNGAAGIIPAVVQYYQRFRPEADQEGIRRFFLSSGAIGILYAKNASISGAEVGCQGEVGVACSMAAAGLAAALNGTNEQVEQAAEIGMEHNLGLTCDPIGGLVQIPCIERNAMGAVKAINASRIALSGDGSHYVSLDAVMNTMMQTGADMKTKYKETSRGGLAVNIPEC